LYKHSTRISKSGQTHGTDAEDADGKIDIRMRGVGFWLTLLQYIPWNIYLTYTFWKCKKKEVSQ